MRDWYLMCCCYGLVLMMIELVKCVLMVLMFEVCVFGVVLVEEVFFWFFLLLLILYCYFFGEFVFEEGIGDFYVFFESFF